MSRSRAAVPAVYYTVVAVLLLLAVTGTVGSVFSGPVGKHLGEDSEGLLLALVLPAWVQYVRPRLAACRSPWSAVGLVSAALATLGLVLLSTDDLAGRVETLNEPVLALAVLLPYVQLPRPLPLATVLALPVGVLLLIAVAAGTALVTDLAECLAMLVLAPIGLDLVDRAVLQPGAPSSDLVRWSWYAFLLLAPAAIALAAGPGASGALRYGERLQEAFLGVLVAQAYLGTAARRTRPGRHRSPAAARAPRTGAVAGRGGAAAVHPSGCSPRPPGGVDR